MMVGPFLLDASDPLGVTESKEMGHSRMLEISCQGAKKGKCFCWSDLLYYDSAILRSS